RPAADLQVGLRAPEAGPGVRPIISAHPFSTTSGVLRLSRAGAIHGLETVNPASMRSLPSLPVRTAIFPPEPSRTLILRRSGLTSIFAWDAARIIVGTIPVSMASPVCKVSGLDQSAHRDVGFGHLAGIDDPIEFPRTDGA